MTMTQLEALRPALAAWNLRQQRARDDYAAHPIAACVGVRRVDEEALPCDAMATHDRLCRRCAREDESDMERMRRLRKNELMAARRQRMAARKEVRDA